MKVDCNVHLKYGEHGDGKAVKICGWSAFLEIKGAPEKLHTEQCEYQYEEEEEEE